MTVSLTFRTTDNTRWGVGSGADVGGLMSPTQVDMNFWNLKQAVETLEGLIPDAARGIDSFTVLGDQMFANMSDATQEGPYTLPVFRMTSRGFWQAATSYNLGDLIINGEVVYQVIFAHVSNAAFDPAANDGLGNDYYATFLDLTGFLLPAGGTTGQYLSKTSNADYAVGWASGPVTETPGIWINDGVPVGTTIAGPFAVAIGITDRLNEVIYYPAAGGVIDITSEWEISAADEFSNVTYGFTDTTGGRIVFRWTHFGP